MLSGWVKIPRSLVDDTYAGRITPSEQMALINLMLVADPETGVARASAPWLSALAGYASRSTMDRALRSLERKHRILRDYVLGAHGNFSILIDRYPITMGEHSGQMIDLAATLEQFHIPDELPEGKGERDPYYTRISAAVVAPKYMDATDSPAKPRSKKFELGDEVEIVGAVPSSPAAGPTLPVDDAAVERVGRALYIARGRQPCDKGQLASWRPALHDLLEEYEEEHINNVIRWAAGDEKFWAAKIRQNGRLNPAEYLADRMATLVNQCNEVDAATQRSEILPDILAAADADDEASLSFKGWLTRPSSHYRSLVESLIDMTRYQTAWDPLLCDQGNDYPTLRIALRGHPFAEPVRKEACIKKDDACEADADGLAA
jgi:hypothetical protein